MHKLNSFFRGKNQIQRAEKSGSRSSGVTEMESGVCDVALELSRSGGQDGGEKGCAGMSDNMDVSTEARRQEEGKRIAMRESIRGMEEGS